MCGSISAHSSSVVSLAYRSPSRRYLMRVISVHDILGSPSLLTPRQNHKWLESLNSIFGQPLRSTGVPAQHNKSYDKLAFVVVMATSFIAAPARAHFQELIPSADIVSRTTGETILLDVVFTHPFEGGPVMDMGIPVQFGVLARSEKQDLRSSLMPHPVAGKNAYQ